MNGPHSLPGDDSGSVHPPAGEGDSPTSAPLSDSAFSNSAFNDRGSQIFLDKHGLRPIWRLFVYFAMSRALYLLLDAALSYSVQHFDVLDLWIELASEIILLIAVVVPALVMSRLEWRDWSDYGLPQPPAFGRLFWSGCLWGILALSLLIFALRGANAFTFGRLALHGVRILKFAAFWWLFFLVVALAEEFLMRGYSQFTLTQAIGFWPAAIPLSLVFGGIHFLNPGEAWNGIGAAAGIGFFFCLTLRRTGTLWFAVGFHAAWDWGESFLYSVPDSGGVSPGHLLKSSLHGPHWLTGGSVGPEGSVLLYILLILLWISFNRIYPEVKYNSKSPIRTLPSE